ncbi:hypothetical protein FPQ18DRAFT_387194 [Pyronema domesticum]|nr:hypothetical protein FPQ18DRAFT_387194 [Pyronema domesticum]
MSISDSLFDFATGTNITDAIKNFQECIVRVNHTSFGQGNPDLGGIGVVLSLYVLCYTCTICSILVIALGFTFDKKAHRWGSSNRQSHKTIFRALRRINAALTTALRSLLDSALYLSLTIQIAAILYGGDIKPRKAPYFVIDLLGGDLYNFILTLYTSIITICPVLTLISTPYLRTSFRRRDLRLVIVTAAIACAGHLNIDRTKIYKSLAPEFPKEGCVPGFLVDLLPEGTEFKLLRTSWALCAAALGFLVFLEWEEPEKNGVPRFWRKVWGCFCGRWCLAGASSQYHSGDSSCNGNEATYDPTSTSTSKRSPRAKKFFNCIWVMYFGIYIWNHGLPIYLLLRIRWMRRHLRSIIQPPGPSTIIYVPEFANYHAVLTEEAKNWDNDDWSFGQVLTMSLWFPAFLEMVYVLFVGEEPALTGTLPVRFKAVENPSSESLDSLISHRSEPSDEERKTGRIVV